MDNFKKIVKMKTGGSVAKAAEYTKRDRKEVDSADIAQDKKIVKKAIGMHDKQQHDAPTDLTGLKKGGRAKKAVGTVKKYKAGGAIGMSKTAEDKKEIAGIKKTKVEKLCGGKSVKKYADGGEVDNDAVTADVAEAKPSKGSGYDSDPFVKLRKKIFGS